MKKMVIVRNGSCRRCGQCCDKSKAQPMMWALAKETEDPDYRTFSTNKGKRRQPRICDGLAYQPIWDEEDHICFCKIYDTRPPICQGFPANPKDLMEIDNCGYYFTIEWREVDG